MQDASKLGVAIVGAGAVGLGLGSCLAEAGARLHFCVRSETSALALRERALVRSGIFGDLQVPPRRFAVSSRPEALLAAAPSYLLVCTKTTESRQVAETLADLFERFAPTPEIVVCQNGWGNAERFAARLPRDRIWSARVITGFQRASASEVAVTAHAEPIRIGSLFGEDPARIAPLCAAIDAGGIPCETSADIERDLLAKLLYSCALNPLAALQGVPYGAVAESPESRAVLEAVVREVFEVLDAVGLRTHWRDAEAYLAAFFRDLLPPTRSHESSMLQDLRAGRATEIDAISGAVVELGRRAGIDTPVNDALARLIRGAEGGDQSATS